MKPARIQFELLGIPDWGLEDDAEGFAIGIQAINRKYNLGDRSAAIDFVAKVCEVAKRHGHYPDVNTYDDVVCIRLTTPEEGGLTEMDFEMAVIFDHVYNNRLQGDDTINNKVA